MTSKTTRIRTRDAAPAHKGQEGDKKEDHQQLAVKASASPPAVLKTAMANDAGKGLSTKSEDNIVPLVRLLQALSPACQRSKPSDYIEGAEPGDILLKGIALVKAKDGLVVQPAFFHRAFVEWKPNRSGFVCQHEELPVDTKEVPDPRDNTKNILVRANGNIIQETRYHSVFVYLPGRQSPLAFVIPFTSTGHTVSKSWMFLMNSISLNGKRAPSWSRLYRLVPKLRQKDNNEWFVFEPIDLGWVPDEPTYNIGKQLYESFASGEKVAEEPQDDDQPSAASVQQSDTM